MKVTLEEEDKGERRREDKMANSWEIEKYRDSVYVCADAGGGRRGTGAVQRGRNREKDVLEQGVGEKEGKRKNNNVCM